jgi:hypothetical protein
MHHTQEPLGSGSTGTTAMTRQTAAAPPRAHPRDDVLAVIEDDTSVATTVAALQRAGFTEADIHIFRGHAGVTALARAWWRHSGMPAFLGPFVSALLSDERDIEQIYDSEGLAGHTILAVHARTPDDIDEATRVLREYGAHDTWYFGRWTTTPGEPAPPGLRHPQSDTRAPRPASEGA